MAESSRAKLKISLAEKRMLVGFAFLNLLLYIQPLWQTFKLHLIPKDYHTWYVVAQGIRANEALYPPGADGSTFNYFYPPAIAVLFYTPLALGGSTLMTILLLLLSSASYFVSILASVYLATGKLRCHAWPVYVVPVVISIPFAYDIFFMGQLNMTLLALMLIGFIALLKNQQGRAGLLFALCAAAKAFPFPVIVYLLWRRYYTAAASMIVALAVILVVLPAPFRGFNRNLQELSTWADCMLLHNTGTVLANQPFRGYRYGNQALLSVVNRLTRPLSVGKPQDGNLTVNLINVSPSTSFAIAFAIVAALGVALVVAMPPRRLLTRLALALECSIVLLFLVIFSPKADSCYYCWILPGFTVAVAELMRSPRGSTRRRWITLGLAASIVIFLTALTQNFSRLAQGMGATMWGAVLLCLVLLALLWSEKRVILGDAKTK